LKKEKIHVVAIPGIKLGTIEEFIPKRGAYEDENGNIRSLFWGKVSIDLKTKDLVITPFKKLKIVEVGDNVLGRIVNFSSIYGIVEIFAINMNSLDRKFTGTLHPPKVVKEPKDIFKLYKLGDYIYAKVISKLNRTIHLSIAGKDYGVILAFCSTCGTPLVKDKLDNKLKCRKCKNIEERKISRLYGKVM